MDDSSNQEFAEGFVPIIRTSGDVSVREAGALLIMAGGDASSLLRYFGVLLIVSGVVVLKIAQ